eukprot:1778876-Rhodomonas_salina.4
MGVHRVHNEAFPEGVGGGAEVGGGASAGRAGALVPVDEHRDVAVGELEHRWRVQQREDGPDAGDECCHVCRVVEEVEVDPRRVRRVRGAQSNAAPRLGMDQAEHDRHPVQLLAPVLELHLLLQLDALQLAHLLHAWPGPEDRLYIRSIRALFRLQERKDIAGAVRQRALASEQQVQHVCQ